MTCWNIYLKKMIGSKVIRVILRTNFKTHSPYIGTILFSNMQISTDTLSKLELHHFSSDLKKRWNNFFFSQIIVKKITSVSVTKFTRFFEFENLSLKSLLESMCLESVSVRICMFGNEKVPSISLSSTFTDNQSIHIIAVVRSFVSVSEPFLEKCNNSKIVTILKL